MSEIVVVRDLNKSFARVHALSDISLDVHDGELFGIVGPDGAGKTTLFRILVTLLVPESGSATVLGLDVVKDYREIRRRVGYMPGTFSLYPDLSVAENIEFFASVFGTTLEKGYDLIAPVYKQIEAFKDRRAAALSGGMKQKLALCCALVHRPDILFLDEPTTGVDAVSRREFWDQLGRLKASGLTILVSTPYMDEAVRCDRVALVQTGKLLAVDAPVTISEQYDRPLIAISGARRYEMLLALREFPDARSVYPFGDSLHYTDSREHADATAIGEELVKYLRDRGYTDAKAKPIQAGIEDSFMALMGGRTEAA